MTDGEKLARNRFLVLNLVRLGGLALVMFGLAIHYRKVELPGIAAWFFVAMGFVEFFFLPRLLSKSWRTRDE